MLATAIEVAASTPSMWKARGSVPAEYCAPIERATGGKVSRRDLRPTDWHRIWPELVTDEFPAPEEAREIGADVALPTSPPAEASHGTLVSEDVLRRAAVVQIRQHKRAEAASREPSDAA